ncbi:MAG TPA: DUF4388 domain-containing protein [Acidimicrobiales bacterium]
MSVQPLSEVTVALQGTLETFALPDVLQLLASTKKTGRLRLTGGRGSGSIWLDEGEIVAGEASRSPMASGATEIVFELLRFEDGDFVFEADDASAEPGTPVSVEDALSGAESLLAEWTAIEAVVPSTAAFVSLRGDLDGDEVTLPADRWRQVVAVGGGRTVSGLGQHLELSDMAVSRLVKELIELGVVDLGEAPEFVEIVVEPVAEAAAPPPGPPAFSNDAAFADTPSFTETRTFVATPDETPVLSVVDDTDAGAGFDGSGAVAAGEALFDPHALVIEEPTYGAPAAEPEHLQPAPVAPVIDDEPTDAAEIARQLANLSPKAAKAVAAAAKATTQEEREAALAEVDDDEEPINRGLLLKFLGSVNG